MDQWVRADVQVGSVLLKTTIYAAIEMGALRSVDRRHSKPARTAVKPDADLRTALETMHSGLSRSLILLQLAQGTAGCETQVCRKLNLAMVDSMVHPSLLQARRTAQRTGAVATSQPLSRLAVDQLKSLRRRPPNFDPRSPLQRFEGRHGSLVVQCLSRIANPLRIQRLRLLQRRGL